MTEEASSFEGGCNCGAIRYRVAAAPLAVAACHCTGCRTQSGAAYSVNLVVRSRDFTVTAGDLAEFSDEDTNSGQPVLRRFCGHCGSPIISVPTATPKIVAVKAGTADMPGPFAPTVHIWTRSKLPWVEIPANLPQFETEPS